MKEHTRFRRRIVFDEKIVKVRLTDDLFLLPFTHGLLDFGEGQLMDVLLLGVAPEALLLHRHRDEVAVERRRHLDKARCHAVGCLLLRTYDLLEDVWVVHVCQREHPAELDEHGAFLPTLAKESLSTMRHSS